MLNVQPVTLTDGRIRLQPMSLEHVDALKAAAADGELWNLRVTSVPEPANTRAYVERALSMTDRLPFVVVDLENGNRIVGSTSYHDIVPAIDRVEIGWTWYARSTQRSHVNTCAKLLLAEDIPVAALQSKDEKVSIPPLIGALLKNEQDVTLFEKLIFMQRNNR